MTEIKCTFILPQPIWTVKDSFTLQKENIDTSNCLAYNSTLQKKHTPIPHNIHKKSSERKLGVPYIKEYKIVQNHEIILLNLSAELLYHIEPPKVKPFSTQKHQIIMF